MSSSGSGALIDRVEEEDVEFAIKWCVRVQLFVLGWILGAASVALV